MTWMSKVIKIRISYFVKMFTQQSETSQLRLQKLGKLTRVSLLAAVYISNISCGNVFTQYLATTDTDKALLYEAKMLMNQRRYGEAQAKLELTTAAFLAQREVQVLYASTFAGQCGLDVIELAVNLSEGSGGTLFQILLSAFKGGSVTKIAKCLTAQNTLSTITGSTGQNGTTDENFLMIFISLAKIGTILSYAADADANGSVDAGFNKCTDVEFTDQNIAEISVSLARILLSLAAVGASISGLPTANITALCADIDAIPGLPDPCSITDTATITGDADFVKALRVVYAANEIGLASCSDTTANCLVSEPCP